MTKNYVKNLIISFSQMAGGNLKNICQALISIRVPPKTLPTKEKLNNNAYDNGIKKWQG